MEWKCGNGRGCRVRAYQGAYRGGGAARAHSTLDIHSMCEGSEVGLALALRSSVFARDPGLCASSGRLVASGPPTWVLGGDPGWPWWPCGRGRKYVSLRTRRVLGVRGYGGTGYGGTVRYGRQLRWCCCASLDSPLATRYRDSLIVVLLMLAAARSDATQIGHPDRTFFFGCHRHRRTTRAHR